MKENGNNREPVLLVGKSRLTSSIASCMQKAGYPFVQTSMDDQAGHIINGNATEIAIAITEEDFRAKQAMISNLEVRLGSSAIIAINTETISLDLLQRGAKNPLRIIGVNWTEPADTTSFLEIIANDISDKNYAERFCDEARDYWNKDPYIIHGNTGVRMRLLAAMIREAFYLVKNGYATFEDIDRACRNDAGYYLPFAGNLRYMDLMGTYAYGMVMKDLNPELSTDLSVPDFFANMVIKEELGMEMGKGFYKYENGEGGKWEELLRKFSYEVQELIEKYPFNYNSEAPPEQLLITDNEQR